MGIKRIITSATLLFLLLSVVRAQDVKTNSNDGSYGSGSEKIDSLHILAGEVSRLKAQLASDEAKRQYDKVWKRKKYLKLGLSNPSIERTDGEAMAWKTDFAVFLQMGRTAYLHSKPVWGMVKFGIDYGFADISYAKLKLKTVGSGEGSTFIPGTSGGSNPDGFDEIVSDEPSGSVASLMGIDLGMHKFEYGLHVGPSISVNPWKGLIVTGYFHAMPTMSGILENDKFSYGFGCAMAAGGSISYKAISIGVEGLWSTIKYKQASFDDEDSDGEGSVFDTEDFKLKQKGPRFYIALKF